MVSFLNPRIICNLDVEEGLKLAWFWDELRPAAIDWIRRVDRQCDWVWTRVLVRTAGLGLTVLLYLSDASALDVVRGLAAWYWFLRKRKKVKSIYFEKVYLVACICLCV